MTTMELASLCDKLTAERDAARAELAEVRDQLGRAEHFVGCVIQAFHRAGLNDFNLRDIDANIAEVRRQTAQSCANTAVTARERWHARNDASAEVAAGCIAQDIRREFALAEQPPQPQAQQQADETTYRPGDDSDPVVMFLLPPPDYAIDVGKWRASLAECRLTGGCDWLNDFSDQQCGNVVGASVENMAERMRGRGTPPAQDAGERHGKGKP